MVDNFSTYIFREEYKRIEELGDTLSNISSSIDWNVLEKSYHLSIMITKKMVGVLI